MASENGIVASPTRKRWPWRTTLIILALIFGILFFGLVIRYVMIRNSLATQAFDDATSQALAAAEQLDTDFMGTMDLTKTLAKDLSSGSLAYEDIQSTLQNLLEQNQTIQGITVAFANEVYSPEAGLYYIYVYRDSEGGIQSQRRESLYDYTLPPSEDEQAPQTAWYYVPANSGAAWTEPYLATGAGQVLISYGVPFYAVDGDPAQPAGVVSVEYSLAGMRSLVTDLDLGLTGYGAVFSDSGTFLSHPVPDRIAVGNIFSDPTLQGPEFQDAAHRALQGETLSVEVESNDQPVWSFFTPLESTGWALVVQLAKSEYLLGNDILLINLVAITLAGGTFLFFLIAVLLHFDEATRDRLWLASITFSLIGLGIILIIIGLARNTTQDLGDDLLLTSQATVNRYLEKLSNDYTERGLAVPVEVPTGILIQSARFPEPSIVTLTGYLWQRIPKVEGMEISPGITFPQLIDEPYWTEEVYREEREDETYILWAFNAALRQAFDPQQYPLDLYDINIRLDPLEVANNILLVPDFSAYNVTTPRLLPGLDDTVVIKNWRVMASAFGMGFRRFGTNLGLPQRITVDVPELAFNIRIERLFLGPFIAFFLPAFVAAIMIFGFLLIEQKPDDPEEIVTALTYTAALFFVVAVLHTALRDNAAAIGLTYLEYFYLLLYVLTLFVAFNSFLVVKFPYLPIVSIGNNLIAKLLFWPIVVSFMLLATIYVFVLSR
ncbi:MAG: hypothetical protein ACK2T4_05470 [Candidatus Promineifilaceae bacterium]|jgi:hypothetical protein